MHSCPVGKIVRGNSRINFWDLGGQTSLRTLWHRYYSQCHGILFLVDSTDHDRIAEAIDALKSVINHDSAQSVPLLMVANKQDRPGAIEIHAIKELLNPMASMLGARESTVLGISALTGYQFVARE